MTNKPDLQALLTRLVWRQGDTQDILEQKKLFIINNLIVGLGLSCMFVLAVYLDLSNIILFGYYIFPGIILFLAYLIVFKRGVKYLSYISNCYLIIILFLCVARLGGLANSAGIVVGIYGMVLATMYGNDTKLLLTTGLLYVLGVFGLGIVYPYLTIDKELFGWKNNLYFTINSLWTGLFTVVFLYKTLLQSAKEAKNKAARLQELDVLKTKLYHNVAHEFRTPLTLIKGMADLVRERQDTEDKGRIDLISKNADKILFLVNQMLNLSKVEHGGITLNYVQSDLIRFLKYIINSFHGLAEFRKIRMHFLPSVDKLLMDFDAEHLEEVIANLVSNALKYNRENGDVYISVQLHDAVDETSGSGTRQVEISVRDTGFGIPGDQLDKIFIRFYRVEDDRYPYQEGNGIGLALVGEYLKLMKGTIKAVSKTDVGSEFVITLPVTQHARLQEDIEPAGTFTRENPGETLLAANFLTDGTQPTLLIAEDNKDLLAYLSQLLIHDYNLLFARDGNEGIEVAVEKIPDLILSDVMMPGKDGFRLCKELKNDIRTNHIPIVLLTARSDKDSRILGLEQGADAYLTKPFDKRELHACLHNLFVQREKIRLKYRGKYFILDEDKPVPGLNEQFLNKAIQCLEQNYKNEGFGIEHFYNKLGISRVQLHRKLTAITGQSASNFIRNFRLEKARSLLLQSEMNVSEIAYQVGFGDPSYFTRTFSDEFGVSPSELRKSFR